MPNVKHIPNPESPSLPRAHSAVRTDKDRERVWQECQGLDHLGLVDEAKKLMDSLPLNGDGMIRFRALRLRLDSWGPDADKAATDGLALIETESPNPFLVSATATALLTSGRGRQSWALLRKYGTIRLCFLISNRLWEIFRIWLPSWPISVPCMTSTRNCSGS